MEVLSRFSNLTGRRSCPCVCRAEVIVCQLKFEVISEVWFAIAIVRVSHANCALICLTPLPNAA